VRACGGPARLLCLSLGQSLRELRGPPDLLMQAHAFGREHSLLARIFPDAADILGSRVDKLPERQRSSAYPRAPFCAGGWSPGKEPDKNTVGSLLKPTPPVRRYADFVRHLVQTTERLGFKGAGTIAATLARAGCRGILTARVATPLPWEGPTTDSSSGDPTSGRRRP